MKRSFPNPIKNFNPQIWRFTLTILLSPQQITHFSNSLSETAWQGLQTEAPPDTHLPRKPNNTLDQSPSINNNVDQSNYIPYPVLHHVRSFLVLISVATLVTKHQRLKSKNGSSSKKTTFFFFFFFHYDFSLPFSFLPFDSFDLLSLSRWRFTRSSVSLLSVSMAVLQGTGRKRKRIRRTERRLVVDEKVEVM